MAGEVASILDGVPLSVQRRFPELENRHIDFLKKDIIKAMNKAAALDEIIPGLLVNISNSQVKGCSTLRARVYFRCTGLSRKRRLNGQTIITISPKSRPTRRTLGNVAVSTRDHECDG